MSWTRKIKPRKIVVRNLTPVQADALVRALQVRRGIEPGAQARRRQNRRQRRGRRALPIGPGNQHRRELLLRIAQRRQQHADLVEREFPPRLAGRRIQLGRHGVQLVDGRRVGHGKLQYKSSARD